MTEQQKLDELTGRIQTLIDDLRRSAAGLADHSDQHAEWASCTYLECAERLQELLRDAIGRKEI